MSLKHALLGFINYGPLTGYELKKFFDTSVAHFWNAELSQIYPALKAMETEGLVEMRVDVQEDRPNRKVYSITEDGRRELRKWLAQPAEPEQVREPLLIKVFFGASLSKQELIAVIQDQIDQRERARVLLERAASLIPGFAHAIGLERDALFWALTVEAGIKICQAEVDWAEEAIRKIQRLHDSEFPARYPDWGAMNPLTATDILEKIKIAMPEALASATIHHTAGQRPK